MKIRLILSILCGLVCCVAQVQARELGHHVPSVANIRDFAVPPAPGFYYEQYNLYYTADTFRDRNGDSVNSLTVGGTTIQVNADVDVYVVSPLFCG